MHPLMHRWRGWVCLEILEKQVHPAAGVRAQGGGGAHARTHTLGRNSPEIGQHVLHLGVLHEAL